MGVLIPGFITLTCISLANAMVIPAVNYTNVSYGNDAEQIADVYLPLGRNACVTKVIVFIHGGGWYSGSKEVMIDAIYPFMEAFPLHALVNMDYRLATDDSPAYPKQIEDIRLLIKFITKNKAKYHINPKFAFVGISSGATIGLLYGYSIDKCAQIKAICNVVGLTDATDPALNYTSAFLKYYVGDKNNYMNNPALFKKVSPVTYVTHKTPKTISFYGGKDMLSPVSQGIRLRNKLNKAKVVNEYYLYKDEQHLFTPTVYAKLIKTTTSFFKKYL